MKCDRFVGTGIPSDRCLKSKLSTGNDQSSDTSTRRYSSKQKSSVDHHSYSKVILRSKSVKHSWKGLSRGKAVSLIIENFPENRYTTVNSAKYKGVITILNDLVRFPNLYIYINIVESI